MSGGYDEAYKRCGCLWGTEPGSFLRLLTHYVPSLTGQRVLDAGCGEGKNAVFLAQLGAIVDAVDVSVVAIKNGRKFWKQQATVRWVVADIRHLKLTHKYDVAIAYGLFHCFPDRAEVLAGISTIQAATVRGGYNIVCAFNNRHQQIGKAHPGFRPCLLDHREYLSAYESWHVLAQSDLDLTERHRHNNIDHTHSLSRILAKKLSK